MVLQPEGVHDDDPRKSRVSRGVSLLAARNQYLCHLGILRERAKILCAPVLLMFGVSNLVAEPEAQTAMLGQGQKQDAFSFSTGHVRLTQ